MLKKFSANLIEPNYANVIIALTRERESVCVHGIRGWTACHGIYARLRESTRNANDQSPLAPTLAHTFYPLSSLIVLILSHQLS